MRLGRSFLANVLETVPVIAFVTASRFGATDEIRFFLGGGLAAAVLITFLAARRRFDPLLLAGNLYMGFVAANFLLYAQTGIVISPIAKALLHFRETGWLIAVLIVGVVCMVRSPYGLIAVDDGLARDAARRASLLLLIAAIAATAWSYVFRGTELVSAVAPIVALFLLRRLLIARGRTNALPPT